MNEQDNLDIWQDNYKNPDIYNYQSGGNRWQRYLLQSILENVESDVDSVLDVGCGAGVKTELLAQRFPIASVKGIDFAGGGVEKALQYRKTERLNFECTDIYQALPKIKPSSYDMVTSFQVLEHLEKWQEVLRMICDIARRYVVISVPTGRMRSYEVLEGHLRNYKKGEIEAFMEQYGYRTIKTYYAGFPFYSPVERDARSLMFNSCHNAEQNFQYKGGTKLLHDIVYVLFRYFTFNHIGDQFIGIFKKGGQLA